jgi:O-phosphoseryl-tRNA(Cys) synthetase
VKPFLTSYHKFYCIVVDDEVRADDSNALVLPLMASNVLPSLTYDSFLLTFRQRTWSGTR